MAGLMKPTEGHIYIADQDIVKYGKTSLLSSGASISDLFFRPMS